jgi:hypothetical protein
MARAPGFHHGIGTELLLVFAVLGLLAAALMFLL